MTLVEIRFKEAEEKFIEVQMSLGISALSARKNWLEICKLSGKEQKPKTTTVVKEWIN